MVGPLASTIGIICFLLVARTSARLNHTRCELCTGGDSPLKCSGQTPCQLCNVSVSGGRLRSVSKAGVHIVCSTFHTFNELGTRLLDKVTSPAPPSLGRTHRMATRSGMEVARASAPWVQSLYSPLRRTCQLLAVNWGMDTVAPSVVEGAGSDNSVVTEVDTVSDPAMIPQSFQHPRFSLIMSPPPHHHRCSNLGSSRRD